MTVDVSDSSPSTRDRLLLLTCEVETFALQLENMAVRHPQLGSECLALAARMRRAAVDHRQAVRKRASRDGEDPPGSAERADRPE